MRTCDECGTEIVDPCLCDRCWNKAQLASSESKPSEAGAREATVSGPTHGSPKRERGDQAGPERQQPRSPPEAGAESERSCATCDCQDDDPEESPCCYCVYKSGFYSKWRRKASAEANTPREVRETR